MGPQGPRQHLTVCYSGGLDSTYVAHMMGKELGGDVHLFTMLPYGQLFPRWADHHARDLERLLAPQRVLHHYEDTRVLFSEIVAGRFFKDWWRYRGHFIWCLGCHCAMVARVVIYNLERQIPHAMIASSVGGEYAVMSMPVTHDNWRRFYAEYGIKFWAPLLERNIDKPQERKELREQGVWIGTRFNRAVLGVQPLCIFGLQHILDILFHVHTKYNPVNVNRFLIDKKDIMDHHIRGYFHRRGIDVDALITSLKSQHAPGTLVC